LIYHL